MKRDWSDANEKRTSCRVCGNPAVELAHVIGRSNDRPQDGRTVVWVNPDSVVPLCREHHTEYDAHQLDLMSRLTMDEQVQSVRDAGGIELARQRICSAWTCQNCGAVNALGDRLPIKRCLLCGRAENEEEPLSDSETELHAEESGWLPKPDRSLLPPFLR